MSLSTLIRYRAFRNSDPPQLADLWRSQLPRRGLMQPMSATLFDQLVLAKPYFDRQGLIVAAEHERLVGFAHAGFGPSENGQLLSSELGVTCVAMTHPQYADTEVPGELLARSEAYLCQRGAKSLYAGGLRCGCPFYLGLIGGAQSPGVLDSDPSTRQFYRSHSYQDAERIIVLHRPLASFRAPVDRRLMQIRRSYEVRTLLDPPFMNWWDACTRCLLERTAFEMADKYGTAFGAATFCSLGPLATTWGVNTYALLNVEVAISQRRRGFAAFLLGEAFRRLQAQGVAAIEAQVPEHDTIGLALLKNLGFEEVDRGSVLHKSP